MRMGNKNCIKEDSSSKSVSSPPVSRTGSRKSCPVGTENISVSSDPSSSNQPTNTHELRYKPSMEDPTGQPIQLSPYQKSILREAWQRISKKGTGNIGSLIFRRMMAKNCDIKRLFQHITGVEGVFGFGLTPIKVYRHHSVLFVKVLDSAIGNLDDLRPFVLECIEYGEKHSPYRKYGFSPGMWDAFGQCVTEAAREWEGWKKHRETLRAWTILVSFIVDRMRQGYENAVRKDAFMEKLAAGKHSLSVDERDAPDGLDDEGEKEKAHVSTSDSTLMVKDTSIKLCTSPRRRTNWGGNCKKKQIMHRSKSDLDIHLEHVGDELNDF